MKKVTFKGNEVTLTGEQVKVGDIAKEFKAIKNDLSEFNSKDHLGKILVYSVVPSIDTGVCSIQAKTFNEEATNFSKDVEVYTISLDLPFAQSRFCAAQGIERAEIISDYKEREFGLKYGFLIDELKLLSRGVVIVDQNGKIAYVEYVEEVSKEVDFNKAVEEIKKLVRG